MTYHLEISFKSHFISSYIYIYIYIYKRCPFILFFKINDVVLYLFTENYFFIKYLKKKLYVNYVMK
jgi:hypothetical protein